MQKLLRLSRAIDQITEKIGQFALWLVLLMVGVGVWNVVGRYIGKAIGQNLTSNALIEGQWYIFDLVFLLGAAYALKHDEHVRVDVFYGRWNRKWKAIANLIGTIFFLIPFSLLVIYVSWDAIAQSWITREVSPDPGGLARYPIKTMIIVSFALLIIQGISEIIKNWAIYTDRMPFKSDLSVGSADHHELEG
ncbi:TRAP transporter small permease subunit [Myxacorys almedinensis]|uniref:TRAP transporter small permease subunit n=1 Tax=Myxacorys almedinensis A TaxID=2690445 RepID=A0A8J7YYD6_9CYAN|nr:TRAP transporter small permease subunit [Myxacorys almedinensis]NDJ16814.1 TRAP transporter small permease subunit [Myxacorys almedinensis A]